MVAWLLFEVMRARSDAAQWPHCTSDYAARAGRLSHTLLAGRCLLSLLSPARARGTQEGERRGAGGRRVVGGYGEEEEEEPGGGEKEAVAVRKGKMA